MNEVVELNNKIIQVYRKVRWMTLKEWCLRLHYSYHMHTHSQFHKHKYVYIYRKKEKWVGEERGGERESYVPASSNVVYCDIHRYSASTKFIYP